MEGKQQWMGGRWKGRRPKAERMGEMEMAGRLVEEEGTEGEGRKGRFLSWQDWQAQTGSRAKGEGARAIHAPPHTPRVIGQRAAVCAD